MSNTPLILVSEHLIESSGQGDISGPRRDYYMLAERICATMHGYSKPTSNHIRLIHQLERRLKIDILNPVVLQKNSSNHNIVVSMSEKAALPWGAIGKMAQNSTPHIVIAHKLSTGAKAYLWRMVPASSVMTHVICVCSKQAEYAVETLGMPRSNVNMILHHVDDQFFKPQGLREGNYVLAVGSEQRDFLTLIRAMEGTSLKLVVVANKHVAAQLNAIDHEADLHVLSNIPYLQLRELYEQARMVVVPLNDVDYAAGSTALLEAMAMERPAIVSQTSGITDYVVENETGLYVAPRNVLELRDKIRALDSAPAYERARLGENARVAVAESMNSDYYVAQVADLVNRIGRKTPAHVSQL